MNKIITISREYGAGGHSIGQRVAEELGIPFYDRDILRQTAREGGFDLDLVEKEEEDISLADSFLKGICSASSQYFHDTQDAIHDVQKAILLRFAQQGPCVILGRCADVIFTQAGVETLNIFIHADEVHRAVRVGEITGSTNATEIQKLMVKKDSSRHNFYHHYTGKKWGESRNYHLTLDSGMLGYELCTKLIVEAAKSMD